MPTGPRQRSARGDLHNCSVDAELAEAGLCAMTQLSTGRVCLREARHTGSCQFATREEVEATRRDIRRTSVAS